MDESENSQIFARVAAVLVRRRSTVQEVIMELGLSVKQVENALGALRRRGGLQSEAVISPNPLCTRAICRYWMDASDVPKVRAAPERPRCGVCRTRQVYARGVCRKCFKDEYRSPDESAHLRVPRAEIPPLYRVCDGREFEVVFDGRVR